jgi:hypothetical protein
VAERKRLASRGSQNATARARFKPLKHKKRSRHIGCSSIFGALSHFITLKALRAFSQKRATAQRVKRVSHGSRVKVMYLAVMVLIAIVVVAAVLILEQRGDPQMLERDYSPKRTRFKEKK